MSTPTDSEMTASNSMVSTAFVQALKRLLRPLIRLLLHKQVSYPYLCTLLKELYVDVAAHDFPLSGKKQTDSRLSLITGVHRKDVRRLLSEEAPSDTIPASVSFGSRLITRWNSDPEFLDGQHKPKPLPRLPQPDGSASFEKLVSTESKDIRARAVVDEWLRLGIIEIDQNDRITLCAGGFVPSQGEEEKLYFFGRNVRDHMETAVHNVLNQQPPLLERSVFASGLSSEQIAELAGLSEELSMEVLRKLHQRAQELKAQATPSPAASGRITLGVYFYADKLPHEGEPPHA